MKVLHKEGEIIWYDTEGRPVAKVFRGRGLRQRWRYRIIGGNSKTMNQSESYRDKTDAARAVDDLFERIWSLWDRPDDDARP